MGTTRYKITYHPKVVRDDISTLGSKEKERILNAIEAKLTPSPEIFGKPLRQSLKGHRSLRVGEYRVIFRVADRVVIIFAIMHRSIVYDQVLKRAT